MKATEVGEVPVGEAQAQRGSALCSRGVLGGVDSGASSPVGASRTKTLPQP